MKNQLNNIFNGMTPYNKQTVEKFFNGFVAGVTAPNDQVDLLLFHNITNLAKILAVHNDQPHIEVYLLLLKELVEKASETLAVIPFFDVDGFDEADQALISEANDNSALRQKVSDFFRDPKRSGELVTWVKESDSSTANKSLLAIEKSLGISLKSSGSLSRCTSAAVVLPCANITTSMASVANQPTRGDVITMAFKSNVTLNK